MGSGGCRLEARRQSSLQGGAIGEAAADGEEPPAGSAAASSVEGTLVGEVGGSAGGWWRVRLKEGSAPAVAVRASALSRVAPVPLEELSDEGKAILG